MANLNSGFNPTNNPFGKNFNIVIKHLPTNRFVEFEGWVTEFNDQFTSDWNSETVYGRMDPLVTFQRTGRVISLAFDVVADNAAHAAQNLGRIGELIQFLYPVYDDNERSVQTRLKAAPLIGLKWTNLASSADNNRMLTGYLGGVNYNPDLTVGGFLQGGTQEVENFESYNGSSDLALPDPGAGAISTSYTTTTKDRGLHFIPKKVSINLQYTVIHTHLMGWAKSSKLTFGGKEAIQNSFPHSNKVKVKSEQTTRTGQAPAPPEVAAAEEAAVDAARQAATDRVGELTDADLDKILAETEAQQSLL